MTSSNQSEDYQPSFSGQPDYLLRFQKHEGLKQECIRAVRAQGKAKAKEPRYEAMIAAVNSLPDASASVIQLDQDIVTIGRSDDLAGIEPGLFESCLEAFIPWKKGPFSLFGTHIDAEWQSDMKWRRVEPHLDSLEGHVVADIGCNNGYFMYRMASHRPDLVIGFEPESRHLLNFQLLQKYARQDALYFETLGVEHMDFYPGFFDTVFCMGILYHHTDPIGLLRKIHTSMRKGGQLIIECQGIPGDDPVALVPEGRYTRARGFWWLPTNSCLVNWIRRAGFPKVQVFEDVLLTPEEQRRSKYAPIDSLADFLDPNDPTKTIEGYPAPRRFYVKAIR